MLTALLEYIDHSVVMTAVARPTLDYATAYTGTLLQ